MTSGQAILLGFAQGVAEFLPISSSGHLAVLQNFLAIGDMENHLLFDVLLHLGTLAAVFLALRGEISPLWNEGLRMLHLKKTRRGEEPDSVKRRMIWFLIAATLPLALAAVLWLAAHHGGTGRTAVLRYGDPQVEQRIDLRKNAEYDIDTGLYTIHLRVENGGIAFVDSPCPDHLCEGFGTLKNEGDWAACMPAKASLTIE